MDDSNNSKTGLLKFRRGEGTVAALMFSFFFLVIMAFQLIRPLKKGIFIEYFGADTELYAKLLNIVISAVGVVVFTWLVNHLERQKVITALCGFFVLAYIALAMLLPVETGSEGSAPAIEGSARAAVWGFYLLGDLWSTMMVAGFWAYLTDISNSDQAKRLYGLIGAGGVIGGWIGATIAKTLLGKIGMMNLLFVNAAIIASIVVIVILLEAAIDRGAEFRKDRTPLKKDEPGTGAAVEGARLVFRSGYLAAIAGIMLFYEIGSQVNDYQFSKFSESLEGVANTQAFLSNVAFYANALAVVVQLFIVSFVLKRFGVLTALLVLPLALIGSATAFFIVPTLAVASLLFISDNGLNYSIQQTSRETLYVVTTPDEKYKARAFTTMFIQRVAKGLGIFVVLGLGALGLVGKSIRHLSIVTIVVMGIMVILSIYAGKRFATMSKGSNEPDAAPKIRTA